MSCKHIPYQDGNICTSSDFKKMIKDKPYNIYYAQCAVCGEKIAAPKSVTRIKLILDLVGTVGLTVAVGIGLPISNVRIKYLALILAVLSIGCMAACDMIIKRVLAKGTWRSCAHCCNELRHEEKNLKILMHIQSFLGIIICLIIVITSMIELFT